MEVPMLVTDFLDRAARLYPDKVAVVDGDRRYTYREIEERVDRLSNALLDLGLRPHRSASCSSRSTIGCSPRITRTS